MLSLQPSLIKNTILLFLACPPLNSSMLIPLPQIPRSSTLLCQNSQKLPSTTYSYIRWFCSYFCLNVLYGWQLFPVRGSHQTDSSISCKDNNHANMTVHQANISPLTIHPTFLPATLLHSPNLPSTQPNSCFMYPSSLSSPVHSKTPACECQLFPNNINLIYLLTLLLLFCSNDCQISTSNCLPFMPWLSICPDTSNTLNKPYTPG